MLGYLYILKNRFIPNLVKIGFTERDPKTRAAELSGNTGVPGHFEIVFSWFVSDASNIEKRIHRELALYRRTGEFFELTPRRAKEAVTLALKTWGAIGADGLSFEGRKLKEEEERRASDRKIKAQREKDSSDFDLAMKVIVQALEERERKEGTKALERTELRGFWSFRSSDTPARREAIRAGIEQARSSLAIDLNLPWLFKCPDTPITLPSDIYLVREDGLFDGEVKLAPDDTYNAHLRSLASLSTFGRSAEKIPMVWRLPKGVQVSSSYGWRFEDQSRRDLVSTVSGETLRWARVLSEKSGNYHADLEGRRYSLEDNLGAYHPDSLRVFVGQICNTIEK
jgi:hypothetical protein